MSRFPFPLHRAAGAVTVVLLAGVLAACSGSAGTSQGGTGQGAGQGGQREPGVSGKIAAKAGKTLQVQGTAGQTAVTYTSKTAFTEVVASNAKSLKVGLCATARSADGATASATETIAAGTVTLSKPTGGTCDAGFGSGGSGGNNRPSGAPSGMPSGGPGGAPSGMPSGAANGRGTGASGKIISVDGSSFVVESTRPGTDGKETTTKITVTASAATTWSMVEPATAKAATVGTCATAMGSRSSTGAMTATTLRLSRSVDGACSTGFGGRRG